MTRGSYFVLPFCAFVPFFNFFLLSAPYLWYNTAENKTFSEDTEMNKPILVFTCLLPAIPCQARTITVDDDGPADFNNIQAAIDDSNNANTVIVAEGRYYENIEFLGKNIVLRSTDPNKPDVVANTIIDGNNLGSVVTFSGTEDETCVLAGFTICNGYDTRAGGICGGTVGSRNPRDHPQQYDYRKHTLERGRGCVLRWPDPEQYGLQNLQPV